MLSNKTVLTASIIIVNWIQHIFKSIQPHITLKGHGDHNLKINQCTFKSFHKQK